MIEKQPDKRFFMSLALEPDEGERYLEVLRRARQRDPEASKTNVIRSLFRFPGSDPRLVTKEDREYFFRNASVVKPPTIRAIDKQESPDPSTQSKRERR